MCVWQDSCTLPRMTVIPNFIIKKLYVAGSLRNEADGVAFDIKNTLGPGILTHVASIKLGEREYSSAQIEFSIDGKTYPAAEITDANPVTLMMQQKCTCLMKGEPLPEGKYGITLDMISKEAGKIVITIQDQLSA